MLSVSNLTTSYGLIKALNAVSIVAKEGQVTCILGPEGNSIGQAKISEPVSKLHFVDIEAVNTLGVSHGVTSFCVCNTKILG